MTRKPGLLAIVCLIGMVAGCSHPVAAEPPDASEDMLEYRAHGLDVLAEARDDVGAWQYISGRCQAETGGLKNWSALLDKYFQGRHPDYETAIARAKGLTGIVVSVDRDPLAPNWAMMPKRWSYLDGEWKFDNC